jgi:putative flippase GtrA
MPEAPTGLVEQAGLVERARAFRRTPEFSRIVRYGSVSVVSTVVSLGMLYVFYRVVGMKAWEANVVATAIATVPSYYLNRTWAWGRTGKSHFMREVAPFWIIAAICLLLSSGAVYLADHEASHLTQRQDIRTAIVELANFATYGVIWVGKYTLFNKLLFANRDEDVVELVAAEAGAN